MYCISGLLYSRELPCRVIHFQTWHGKRDVLEGPQSLGIQTPGMPNDALPKGTFLLSYAPLKCAHMIMLSSNPSADPVQQT